MEDTINVMHGNDRTHSVGNGWPGCNRSPSTPTDPLESSRPDGPDFASERKARAAIPGTIEERVVNEEGDQVNPDVTEYIAEAAPWQAEPSRSSS